MKEIKDYLHLYLGCEAIYKNKHWRIIAYNEQVEEATLGYIDGMDVKNVCATISGIKPILRPLSDIKHEEVIEWHDRLFPDYINYSVAHKWNYFNLQLCDFKYSPELFMWLLSKHFDLFGLIEAGLALDATTTPLTK